MSRTFIEKYQYHIVFLLLAIFFISATASMAQKGATFDEGVHLTAGYTYWKTGDFRLNEEHPPLTKLMAAIPLLFIDPELPPDSPHWEEDSQWEFAKEFLYSGKNNPDQLLFWGRFPFVLLGLLLGFYVFKWAKELYGTKAGLFALLLYTFSPNILAHTRLIHTDVGISAGLFITTYYFWKYLQKKTWNTLIIVGICLGVTNAIKFTGIYLIGILILLFVTHLYFEVMKKKTNELKKKEVQQYIRKILAFCILVTIIGFAIISATYFFVNIENYFEGLQFVIEHSKVGHTSFLFGEYSVEGWWYYFILAFLIKTPIATLTLLLLSILLYTKVQKKDRYYGYFLVIPAAVYLIAFMLNNINIGLRHILPIFPFIFVFVSKLVNIKIKNQRIWNSLLAGLAVWYVITSLIIFPHYIGYFNEFIGGPDNGHKYLLDSNIDWGQDTKALQKWLEENNLNNENTRVHLFSNERKSPEHKKISEEYRFRTKIIKCQPTSGIIAISVNKLYDLAQLEEGCTDWLKEYSPIKKIGSSIFVYNITNKKVMEVENHCSQQCVPQCQKTNQEYYDFFFDKNTCLCYCS